MITASEDCSHTSASAAKVIQQVKFRPAETSSARHCPTGTRSVSPRACAMAKKKQAPTTLVIARAVKGGTSLSTNLLTGQLKPHMSAVRPRKASPAPAPARRAPASMDVDTNLVRRQPGLRAGEHPDAGGVHAGRGDRVRHALRLLVDEREIRRLAVERRRR